MHKTISTPKKWKQRPRNSTSPETDKRRIEDLEAELNDLRDFTKLEQLLEKRSETDNSDEIHLREELKDALQQLEDYRMEHQELLKYRVGLLAATKGPAAIEEDLKL